MRLYITLSLLALLVVESMCYYYEDGTGLRRKRSPRYPNFGGGNTGNRRPNYGGGSFPNYGGGDFGNYGGGDFGNYGGGGSFPNFGGGGLSNFFGGAGSFPGFFGNADPEQGEAEARGAIEGVDGAIAEAEKENTKATGIRVGRGRAVGWGKVKVGGK